MSAALQLAFCGGKLGEQERKEEASSQQNLNIRPVFFLFPFFFSEIPVRMCRRAGGMHPDEK